MRDIDTAWVDAFRANLHSLYAQRETMIPTPRILEGVCTEEETRIQMRLREIEDERERLMEESQELSKQLRKRRGGLTEFQL